MLLKNNFGKKKKSNSGSQNEHTDFCLLALPQGGTEYIFCA